MRHHALEVQGLGQNRHIQVTLPELFDQFVGEILPQQERHLGKIRNHLRHQGRQQVGPNGWDDPHAQRPGQGIGSPRRQLRNLLRLIKNALRLFNHVNTGTGQ